LAAEAAWLSHIIGMTQDEVARRMGISRPAVQRLLLDAAKNDMVKIRIDHDSVEALALAARIGDAFGLNFCKVVPSLPDLGDDPAGVSHALATIMESWLLKPHPLTIGLGTGKTLRSAVTHLPHIECQQHTLVSLAGNIAPNGSISRYNVLFSMTGKANATAFSLPIPLVSSTEEELEAVKRQRPIERTYRLASSCDVVFVGIGQMGTDAPLLTDGFISPAELKSLQDSQVAGEIVGWPYDQEGRPVDVELTRRIGSVRFDFPAGTEIIAAAKGDKKTAAVVAALRGRLITSLVIDDELARAVVARI